MIEEACQIPLQTLIRGGFVDSRPYRRIHGWYEIQGNYLRSRFKDSPEKWQRIKHLYENDLPISLHRGNGEGNNPRNNPRSTTDVRTYGRTERTDVRTDVETSARADAPSGAPLAPGEEMTPEEMKRIREKNMGKW